MYVTLWTVPVSPVYVYRHFSHGFVRAGTLREPEKLQLYLAFGRSTTPIPGKGCAWRPHVGKNVQLYLAFLRLTTRIPGKGCSCHPKFVILRRVQSLDQAMGQSIAKIDASRQTVGKMCHFTSRFYV